MLNITLRQLAAEILHADIPLHPVPTPPLLSVQDTGAAVLSL